MFVCACVANGMGLMGESGIGGLDQAWGSLGVSGELETQSGV